MEVKTLKLTENSALVLKKRYLMKDGNGEVVETPIEMFWRVALNIAQAEKKFIETELGGLEEVELIAEQFYQMMTSFDFLPNSPTLMNAGKSLQQLSACFVLPVGDSIEEIFDTVKNTAIIHKSGGGTGFSFSRLRPKNSIVSSTGGRASGPVSFMTVFNSATEVIKQGGTRRGANMGILRVDHPDIEVFIESKDTNDALTNFNISVAITDKFMEAVKEDKPFQLVNPQDERDIREVSARKVFDKIVKGAWKNGEPGIVFIDRMNEAHSLRSMGELESTNPCGEQPLLPYESCNLGSINLGNMVINREVDYVKLSETIFLAVRFLDNVVEMNNYPLPQIAEITRANRKIGLGVMGFADMLIRLGIPYNSEQSLRIAAKIMKFIDDDSKVASAKLAAERGAFENISHSFFDSPMRNATTTTIAPTGTISIIANASSGIEPLFSVVFIRRQSLDGDDMIMIHPLFQEMMGNRLTDDLIKKMYTTGSVQEIEEIPDHIKKVFITAHDIEPEFHVAIQSVFQRHTDNAVSKTANLPNEATVADVEDIYWKAFNSRCKGVTVYRDGSRDIQVLNLEGKKEDEYINPEPRPEVLAGPTRQIKTGCGNLYVTTNEEEGKLFEVFATMGKAGGCASSQAEAIGRLVSLALRTGADPKRIEEELSGISCFHHTGNTGGDDKIWSCADAIGKALGMYLGTKKEERGDGMTQRMRRGACPDCGGILVYNGQQYGCCRCGYLE